MAVPDELEDEDDAVVADDDVGALDAVVPLEDDLLLLQAPARTATAAAATPSLIR